MYQAAAKAWPEKLRALPGVHEVVKAVPRKCVASGSGPVTLRRKLGFVGLLEYFDPYVFSANEVANGKPSPDLFLYASERMGVRPEACLVVEDSGVGVRAALAAGMRVFGFAGASHCRAGYREMLEREGAERVYGTMRELGGALCSESFHSA